MGSGKDSGREDGDGGRNLGWPIGQGRMSVGREQGYSEKQRDREQH